MYNKGDSACVMMQIQSDKKLSQYNYVVSALGCHVKKDIQITNIRLYTYNLRERN